MESTTRKRDPPDQMNIRLGSSYITKFNEYMKSHDGKKVDFIRDALDYWMQVDGNAQKIWDELHQARQTVSMQQEIITELRNSRDKQIESLENLLDEKDARIHLLTKQLEQLQDPYYTHSVRDSVAETVGESQSSYQNEGKKKTRVL